MLDKLESSDFTPYLNQMVQVKTESEGPFELELLEVTDMGSDPGIDDGLAKRRPFSVIFRGPLGVFLPQSIYDVELEKLGTLGLFIVPIGSDKEGMLYQALFN